MAEYARKTSQQQATRRSYKQRFILNRQNLNFPVFRKGDDPQLWIHIADQHFDLYQIPNQFKVSLSEAYIDDEVKCYLKSLSDVDVSWEDWSWLLYEEFNKAQYGLNEERIKEHVDDLNNNWDKISSYVEEIVSNQQKDVEQHTVPESIAPKADDQPQICQEVDSAPKADDQPQICQAIDSTPNLDEHIRSDSFTHIVSFDSELVNGLLGEDEMFSMLGKSEFRYGVEMDSKSVVVHERLENAHLMFDIMLIRGIENVRLKVSVIMGKALKLFENMTEKEGGQREGFVYDLLAHVVEHTYEVWLIRIMDQMYDVLLLHGGATGCGVALDSVTRGIRVRLVEREDCLYGTSSLAAGLACTAALAGAAVLNQGMKVVMFVIKVIEQWYVLGLVRAVEQVHEVLLVRVSKQMLRLLMCVVEQRHLLTVYGEKGIDWKMGGSKDVKLTEDDVKKELDVGHNQFVIILDSLNDDTLAVVSNSSITDPNYKRSQNMSTYVNKVKALSNGPSLSMNNYNLASKFEYERCSSSEYCTNSSTLPHGQLQASTIWAITDGFVAREFASLHRASVSINLRSLGGSVPFFWETDLEGHLVLSGDDEVVKKDCAKECFFLSSVGLRSFEHLLDELKAVPRVMNDKIIAFVVGLSQEYHVDIKSVVMVSNIKLKGTSQQVEIQVMEIFSIGKVVQATKREIEIEGDLKVNVQLVCVNQDNTCLNYRVILQLFNNRDLVCYEELCRVHGAFLSAQTLVANAKMLLNILCLMEINFSRPSEVDFAGPFPSSECHFLLFVWLMSWILLLSYIRKEVPDDNEVAKSLFRAQVALKKSRGEEVFNVKCGCKVEVSTLDQFKAAISWSEVTFVHYRAHSHLLCERYPLMTFIMDDIEASPAAATSQSGPYTGHGASYLVFCFENLRLQYVLDSARASLCS